MRFVVDTSSLINLRKLRWLELLRYPEDQFFCPEKVEQEIKRNKFQNAEIVKLISASVVAMQKVGQYTTFTSISDTDSEVISLATENQSTIISDDRLLRETANRFGVSALDMAGFILLLYQRGRFDQNECHSHLRTLFEKEILSKTKYHQLLMLIGS